MFIGIAQRFHPPLSNVTLSSYVEASLNLLEKPLGPGATSRLRVFLGKCMREAGLKPATAKQWIPFRTHALYKRDQWDKPKPHVIAVFYLMVSEPEYKLVFSTGYYYSRVVDFNVDRLVEELTGLGFQLAGKDQEPRVDLRAHNDQAFFDALFDLVVRTVDELGRTLQKE